MLNKGKNMSSQNLPIISREVDPELRALSVRLTDLIGPEVPAQGPITLEDLDRRQQFVETTGLVIKYMVQKGLVNQANLTANLGGNR